MMERHSVADEDVATCHQTADSMKSPLVTDVTAWHLQFRDAGEAILQSDCVQCLPLPDLWSHV